MQKSLLMQALLKFFAGVILLACLLFIPCGSFHFWPAWLLMLVLFVPMLVAGIIMWLKSPELLQKRLDAKEKEQEQRFVVKMSGLLFVLAFVLAGLNWRFQWILLPSWIIWASAAVFLLSYALYAEVLRENAYLSRTIKVQDNQKVIDSGLYAVVRHPMYAASILMFLSMPLILGSLFSFVLMLAYLPLINIRMKNEEKVLESGLDGYADYKKKVKYRVFPFIW
ncbi:MAG: isoprenylcysteine carboxylmethyltransferase family protein [Bacteroidales bacterium]|nr:isoprenylcysteine carboxylmethyltransferase family protein [Bacteroidales bacterium]